MMRNHLNIRVEFCVDVGNEPCVHETVLEHDLGVYRENLLATLRNEGAIIIDMPGQPQVRIEDELLFAIPGISFASIPQLLAGKPHVYHYSTLYGIVTLEPEDDDVKISGDFIPTIIVSRIGLLEPLYQCGLRFIEYFQRLRGDGWQTTVEELRQGADAAQRVLSPS